MSIRSYTAVVYVVAPNVSTVFASTVSKLRALHREQQYIIVYPPFVSPISRPAVLIASPSAGVMES